MENVVKLSIWFKHFLGKVGVAENVADVYGDMLVQDTHFYLTCNHTGGDERKQQHL